MNVVFLDRDGVINEFPGHGNYVTKVKDFHFVPGALDAIKKMTDAGYKIFVVSNQAGVAKGVYSMNKLNRINQYMLKHVKQGKGKINQVYYCTHRSDSGCDCRKPEIGSIREAFRTLNKNLSSAKNAYFVGDTASDIEAGKNAGCKTIFVLSGKENRRTLKKWHVKPDHITKDLWEATKIILNENPNHSHLRRSRAHKSR